MAVSVFDPHAGKRSDVIREIHQMASSHSGCKCGSCGSSEYIDHKGRSICTYCRTPERTRNTSDSKSKAGSLNNYMASYASISRKRASYDTSAADYARICASLWGG